jgi:hypothetical protein
MRQNQVPGKRSDTRIKPLPLANGHGRYIQHNTPALVIRVQPPGYFIQHISTTTPVVSAPGNYILLYRINIILYTAPTIGFSRISSGYSKPLLGPGGGFTSETAISEAKRLKCIAVIYNLQRPFPNPTDTSACLGVAGTVFKMG